MSIITLTNDHLTVLVESFGAELQSVKDEKGVERLWQSHSGFWNKHAPVLFPFAGSLKGDAYRMDGRLYGIQKHGFAREREFAVERQDGSSVTLLLSGEAARHEGYPFQFAFRVRFWLEENAVHAAYEAENLGDGPLWFAVGAHEAYACPEGYANYELWFAQPETLARSVLKGPLLTGGTEIVAETCQALPIRDALFANDTLVLAGLGSRSVTLKSPLHGRSVRVDFDGFDNLLIWTQIGAPFVCIEPWTNLPDFVDTDQDIAKKPGLTWLKSGEKRAFVHTMTFEG